MSRDEKKNEKKKKMKQNVGLAESMPTKMRKLKQEGKGKKKSRVSSISKRIKIHHNLQST